MISGLLDLPPYLRRRLIEALRTGLVDAPYSTLSLRTALNGASDTEIEATSRGLTKLESDGIAGAGAAAWLEAVERVEARRPRTDLVWSGPEVAGLHARDTRRVYEELLGTAERSVWASTYAYFDGPKAFQVLAQRMYQRPELEVTLLLNIQRKKGETTAADALVRAFADRFWKSDWPGARRPRVFYDPRSLEPDGPGGVLHAKAVVADEEALFVTSANLTDAALDRNFEVGVLLRDRALAANLVRHFRVLIEQEKLHLLPAT